MQRRTMLGGLTGLALGLAGCIEVVPGMRRVSPFESTHDVPDGATLAVTNPAGRLQLQPSTDALLRVGGEQRAESSSALETIDVEVLTGERVEVEVVFDAGPSLDDRRVDLDIAVPAGMVVESVATDHGPIEVRGVTGDLVATSRNGPVTIEDVDGYVTGATENGSVTVTGTTGIEEVTSTNGSLEVDIHDIRSDVHCSTSTGDVTVRAGEQLAVGVDLRTSVGSVSIDDLPYDAAAETRTRVVEGSLRGGEEPMLFVRSTVGSIVLEPVSGA